jgi:hypothetical protein
MQVHKLKGVAKVYLVAALPELCKELKLHQVTVQPKIVSEELFTKKEIQKMNCLTLIIKYCNITYLASTVTKVLKNSWRTKTS